MAPELSIPDYHLLRVEREAFLTTYPTNFGDPERLRDDEQRSRYARFAVRMSFERDYLSYAIKIILPLLIILAMAYLMFFLPPENVDTAASTAMTALLSCMAYNVAVNQSMPDVGYMMLSDKFFVATYVLLLLSLGRRSSPTCSTTKASSKPRCASSAGRVSRSPFLP